MLLADSVGLACSSCSTRRRPRSGSPSCSTTCSRCPSDEIAPIVGARRPRPGSWRAARAAASAAPLGQDADLAAQREIVDAFLAARRDFDALIAVLDPDVVSGSTAAGLGTRDGPQEARGAEDTWR